MTEQELIKKTKDHEQKLIVPDNVRYVAVLIPLIMKDGEANILFEIRNSNISQGNEICFPGGHVEENETAKQAVIREACEELLIQQDQVKIIAPMHRLLDRGRFVIDSYFGIIENYQNTFSGDEVASTLSIPLSWLLEHEAESYPFEMVTRLSDDFPYELIPKEKDYPFAPVSKNFYFYRYDKNIIWGLTGELLYQFLKYLKD